MTVISGGELLTLSLRKNNIQKVFGLVGNHISPFLVHCRKHDLDIVDVRHEQGAIHMADGWSQATRTIGVAIVVGGPGFTNSITGIVKAYMANTPMLVIVGAAVPQQKDLGGLQDMEQIQMIKPYTKWAATVYDVKRIPDYITNAIKQAVTCPMGPVVLEIPISILKMETDLTEITWPVPIQNPGFSFGDPKDIAKLTEIILQSSKPLIIAGDQLYYQHGEHNLRRLIELSGIPVLTVNKARGLIPDSHPLCFGNARVLEAGPQLYALKKADTVIAVGLNMDYQMGFGKPPFFNTNQRFIHINSEKTGVNRCDNTVQLEITGDPGRVLEQWANELIGVSVPSYSPWIGELREQYQRYWDELFAKIAVDHPPISPVKLIREIQKELGTNTIIVLDGSNAMFWGGLLFECNEPGQLIIGPDGTFGSMGSGIPLAIAAKMAYPEKHVVLYTGDGSFGFNAIEMDTAVRFNIPILVVIHNDKSWGFCKSTQEVLYGEANVAAADLGVRRYERLVEALGGFGELVEVPDQIGPAIQHSLHSGLPACINVMVDEDADAPGAIMFNESLKKMK